MNSGCFQTVSGPTCGMCFPLKRQRSTDSCANSVEVYSAEVSATELAGYLHCQHALLRGRPKRRTSFTKYILENALKELSLSTDSESSVRNSD